jgi:hypothetical protein
MIVGTMYIEHIGDMVVKYNEPQDSNTSFDFDDVKEMTVTFTKSGWNKQIRYSLNGKVPVRKGSDKYWVISGKWNESVQAFNEETGETINIISRGLRLTQTIVLSVFVPSCPQRTQGFVPTSWRTSKVILISPPLRS